MNKYLFNCYVYLNEGSGKERIGIYTIYISKENMYDAFDACKLKARNTFPLNEGFSLSAFFICLKEF